MHVLAQKRLMACGGLRSSNGYRRHARQAHDDGVVDSCGGILPAAWSCGTAPVRFRRPPRSCQRHPAGRRRHRSHREADAVAKVPRGFHAAAERPLKLAGRDAFLARAKQVDRLKPQPQRHVAVLEDGADTHGKGLTAGVALAQAVAGGLALKPPDLGRIGVAAMRANRPFGQSWPRRIRRRLLRCETERRKEQIWPWLISYGSSARSWAWVCQVKHRLSARAIVTYSAR